MKRFFVILALAGCGQINMPVFGDRPVSEAVVPVAPVEDAASPTRPPVKPEPPTSVAAEDPPGPSKTLVTLGDVTEPGIWIKTSLVSDPGQGTAVNPATGQSVRVSLIPIIGPPTAGSRASLQAMQALGLNLTDIAEIEVSPL